jgi:hypothetical protein
MSITHATPSSAPGLIGADEWDEAHTITGPLDLPIETEIPAAETDILKLFAQRRARRSLLRMVGQAGVDVSLQPALFGNTVRIWHPTAGAIIGAMGQGGLSAINTGTGAAASTPSIGSANNLTSMARFLFGTGTVAGNTAGVRDASAMYFRGNAAGRGGWFYACRFGIEATAADIQVQMGMAVLSTALAGDPSAFLNCAMIGKDTADVNWHFMHNDGAGAATKVNTGVAVTQNAVLTFFMYAPPNGTSIFFELVDAMTGASLFFHEATTDLPVNTTMLFNRASIRAPTSTTARQLAINRVYTEVDL